MTLGEIDDFRAEMAKFLDLKKNGDASTENLCPMAQQMPKRTHKEEHQAIARQAIKEYDQGNIKQAQEFLLHVKYEWYHSAGETLRNEGYLYHASRMKQAKKKVNREFRKHLHPNGISHTVYPDQPAEDFNEWTANFTRQEVENAMLTSSSVSLTPSGLTLRKQFKPRNNGKANTQDPASDYLEEFETSQVSKRYETLETHD